MPKIVGYVLVRYHTDVWKASDRKLRFSGLGVTPLNRLLLGMQRVMGNMRIKTAVWKKVAWGPLSAALLTAKKLGWHFRDATHIVDEQGETFNLTLRAPRELKTQKELAVLTLIYPLNVLN